MGRLGPDELDMIEICNVGRGKHIPSKQEQTALGTNFDLAGAWQGWRLCVLPVIVVESSFCVVDQSLTVQLATASGRWLEQVFE